MNPYVADAADLVAKIKSEILNPIIGLIGAAGLAFFIWGVAMYIYHVDSPADRETARRHMIYGVIGLAIMVCVFGILNLICSTVGANGCPA